MRSLGLVLVGLLALAAGVAPPASAATALDPSTEVVITGHGWGHGHGLSQYGARQAAVQGLSLDQILDFYYPGTDSGRAAGKVRVLISESTTRMVTVRADRGVVVTGAGKTWRVAAKHPRSTRYRIAPVAGGKDAVEYNGPTGWHTMATKKADLQFQSSTGAPLTLYVRGGTRSYRGALRSVAPDTTRRRWTVNVVPLESYVRGVVAAEMPASWPAAAVQAQAVASRSYAAFERWHGGGGNALYDVDDTTKDQVYGGVAAEQPAGTAAVRATAGRIVTYQGDPAFTQFSSSNGGEMLDGSQPYLVSKPDPYDAASGDVNSREDWQRTVTVRQLMSTFHPQDDISGISVQKVDGTDDTWAYAVTLQGASGDDTVISAARFASEEGLYSANFGVQVAQ